MGRKCKHIVSMESIKHRCEVIAPAFREGDSLGCMTWWTCSKCGDVVPQEKANDDPEAVRVEVRGTELAAQTKGTYCNSDAWSGYFCALNDLDPPPWPHCPDAWAAWLAFAIENHDHEEAP